MFVRPKIPFVGCCTESPAWPGARTDIDASLIPANNTGGAGQWFTMNRDDRGAVVLSKPQPRSGRCLDEPHCPRHGSKYDAMTGAMINGPASRPLAELAVRMANGEAVTG